LDNKAARFSSLLECEAVLRAIDQGQLVHPPQAASRGFQLQTGGAPSDDGFRAFDGDREFGLPVKFHAVTGREFVVVRDGQPIG
jgi:hypothetical protein